MIPQICLDSLQLSHSALKWLVGCWVLEVEVCVPTSGVCKGKSFYLQSGEGDSRERTSRQALEFFHSSTSPISAHPHPTLAILISSQLICNAPNYKSVPSTVPLQIASLPIPPRRPHLVLISSHLARRARNNRPGRSPVTINRITMHSRKRWENRLGLIAGSSRISGFTQLLSNSQLNRPVSVDDEDDNDDDSEGNRR